MNPDIFLLFSKGFSSEDFQFWMDAAAKDDTVFQEFWAIAQNTSIKNNWRAMWVIDHAVQRNSKRLDQILDELYLLIHETVDNSLLRMGLKLICQRPIPANDLTGKILNKCEDLLLNTKTPIATRVNSLQYIFEFCKIEPDLTNELEALMDHLSEHETTSGIHSRIRIIRKALSKLK